MAGVVPEFVKADHAAEIAFVFGKPFLAGDVSMLAALLLLRQHCCALHLLGGLRVDFVS